MKRIILLMILLSLFINIITLCLASDSRADDILNNIKSVLKEFNEYVLIVNMCDGALQYENGIEYDEENGGYPSEKVVLERVDEFGDGEYSYRVLYTTNTYIKK